MIDKNNIQIGDVCSFIHKEIDETISGIILKIEDAKRKKILNGKECYDKYLNGTLQEKDFIFEKVVIEKSIITLYGWHKNYKWDKK